MFDKPTKILAGYQKKKPKEKSTHRTEYSQRKINNSDLYKIFKLTAAVCMI